MVRPRVAEPVPGPPGELSTKLSIAMESRDPLPVDVERVTTRKTMSAWLSRLVPKSAVVKVSGVVPQVAGSVQVPRVVKLAGLASEVARLSARFVIKDGSEADD